MKSLIKLLIVLSFIISSYAEEKIESRYGFLESILSSSFPDAKVAAKVWLEDMVSVNYTGKVNIEFYDSSDTLYQDFVNKKLDMVVLDLNFFFKNKRNILKISDNFWSLNNIGSRYSQYYLVAKKSLNAKDFKSIKNKRISLRKNDTSARVWLDTNLLNSNKSSSANILKEINLVKKENTALLSVFFNKSDFAIVRKQIWDISSELNPSIKKKIEIIQKSEKIHIPFIGLFSKDVDKESTKSFFELSNNINNLNGGKQLVELMKFDSLFKIENEELKKLDKYYEEYFKLKKKYK